jgi:hypothetical protein
MFAVQGAEEEGRRNELRPCATLNLGKETAFRRSAAVLRSQTAQAAEAQTESSRHADRAEVLNHADFWSGKPLRPRRDAKGDFVVERTVVRDVRIAFDPGTSECELSPARYGPSSPRRRS